MGVLEQPEGYDLSPLMIYPHIGRSNLSETSLLVAANAAESNTGYQILAKTIQHPPHRIKHGLYILRFGIQKWRKLQYIHAIAYH